MLRDMQFDFRHYLCPHMSFFVLLQVGLIGFFVVIGMSGLSAKKAPVATPVKAKKKRTPSKSKKSPKSPRSSRKTSTPINKKTGSVQTPAGRRSARLAKRRKED